MSVPFN